jgi:CHAD domain-containing protein
VGGRLRASGATPAPSPPAAPPVERPRTVGDAVRAFLAEQRAAILTGDVRLRRGEDAIHPTRVAVRRVRSVLRAVPVFEPDAAAALDHDLSWVSAVLGGVRDGDVLREHFVQTVDELPDEPWRPATAAAIWAALDEHRDGARARLHATMTGRRYLGVLRQLRSWAEDPPLLDAAQQPVKRLTRYAGAADRVLAKRLAQATDAASTHRARKSAKRARYVSEFVAGTLGGAAQLGDAAKQAKKLQASLGDRQDAAMAADFLAALTAPRAGAELAPAAAFGCGVAWTAERRRAAG